MVKNKYIHYKANIIEPSLDFDRPGSFGEGLAGVVAGGKGGFVDRQGDIVVPCEYDCHFIGQSPVPVFHGIFREGLAFVQKEGKWLILQID